MKVLAGFCKDCRGVVTVWLFSVGEVRREVLS